MRCLGCCAEHLATWGRWLPAWPRWPGSGWARICAGFRGRWSTTSWRLFVVLGFALSQLCDLCAPKCLRFWVSVWFVCTTSFFGAPPPLVAGRGLCLSAAPRSLEFPNPVSEQSRGPIRPCGVPLDCKITTTSHPGLAASNYGLCRLLAAMVSPDGLLMVTLRSREGTPP